MTLPLIEPNIFFYTLLVFQLIDSITTAQELRNKRAIERNKFLRSLIKRIGINQALFLMKGTAMVYLWFNPLTVAWVQWVLLILYFLVCINNIRIVLKNNDK